MSDQRRATLTPFGKSDKKTKGSFHRTFRLRFTLSDPSEDSCPVFDYSSVVKTEEKKFIKKNHEAKSNGIVDTFDSDEDVKRIARKFEAKYGDTKSKCKSYSELGAGYDETDPFIDNTEACDEAIQEDQETFCGGYYINSGPLELKRVEVSDHSDADEIGKRRIKKLSVIEEDNETEENGIEEDDQAKEEQGEIKTQPDVVPESKKTNLCEEPKVMEEKSIHHSYEEAITKKKKKRLLSEDKNSGEDIIKSKKAKTVKDILEEKRAIDHVKAESEKKIASITSISEAIESVVNARNNDENSNSSNSSQCGSAVASSSTSEDSQEGKPSSQIIPTPLPDNLSSEVLNFVEHIKHTAAITENTRKTFCSDINNCLVKVEWKSREFSATNRNLLFSHIACYLPCTKDTLMRRAKKLFIHKEESQIDTIICKLKATIDATMPSLLEEYAKECQRIAEEKGVGSYETSPIGENHKTPDTSSPKLPKRKFLWTDETRGYLREIVRLKIRCYKVLKPRKSTSDEYVSSFLQSKIRLLWPPTWMKTSILLRECNRSFHGGKSKHLSNHTSSKSESPGMNISDSYLSPNLSRGTSLSLHVSASLDSPHQPTRSPPTDCTPVVAAKPAGDPINQLTKITTSLNTSPSNPNISPGSHNNSKTEKTETFLMDCLLKRTSETVNSNDYNTLVSDFSKKDSVIMNGASLPMNNVNIIQTNENCRSDNILDLSSCNNSVSVTPSVIQSTNERTAMCTSDINTNLSNASKPAKSPSKKEVISHISSSKQRHLQLNNWHSQGICDNKKTDNDYKWPHAAHKSIIIPDDQKPKPVQEERRMSEETKSATDMLSQIISESLLAPSQPTTPSSTSLYNSKAFDDGKVGSSPMKGQELFFDVMQDLKELNNLSSGGLLDAKQESKSNNYSGSWSHGKKPEVSTNNSSQFQSQFLKHIMNSQQDSVLSPINSPPYTRHNVSPYDNVNGPYMNEINKSMYNSPQRTAQTMTSHSGTPSKESRVNQGCIMKPLQNMGIASGHRYMPKVDYGTDDQHLLGLASSLPYGLGGWPYPGNESQSHQ